jgi:DNA-binding transcriptional LysR family regulator
MPERQQPPATPAVVADLGELDVGLLLALEALLSERNVTHAAARLGISQSALSARLQRLRQVFDDDLFVAASNGRGMVPTTRAIDLHTELEYILTKLRRMVEGPIEFDPAQSRRTFTIAIQENPAAVLAPGLISQVLSSAPGARLSFVHPPRDVYDRLEQGVIDIFVAGNDKASGDLLRRQLVQDDFLTAQRKGHPRGIGPLDINTFCAMDHVLVSTEGGGFAGLIDEILAASARKRRVAISLQTYALVPLILAHSDCICTLPRRFLKQFANALDFFPPPIELPPPKLFALWHSRSRQDSGHRWIREALFRAAVDARGLDQSSTTASAT